MADSLSRNISFIKRSGPSIDPCGTLAVIKLQSDCTPVITTRCFHRGSYMSAHVLLNLLNEFGKRDKMRGLSSILYLFRNEFNKFNNTRARMLDPIYHMTLR